MPGLGELSYMSGFCQGIGESAPGNGVKGEWLDSVRTI